MCIFTGYLSPVCWGEDKSWYCGRWRLLSQHLTFTQEKAVPPSPKGSLFPVEPDPGGVPAGPMPPAEMGALRIAALTTQACTFRLLISLFPDPFLQVCL